MNTPAQNILGLFAGIWPRIIGFSNAPSLLVIALIANLVAVIPTAFRMQRENLASQARTPACAEATSANVRCDGSGSLDQTAQGDAIVAEVVGKRSVSDSRP